MDSPLEITIWDKARTRRVWIGDPISVTVTPRHNLKPSASIVVPVDHKRIPALIEPGARVVVRHTELTSPEDVLCSGPVTLASGRGPTLGGTMTFNVEGDFRILENTLGWVKPALPITQQGSADGTGADYDRFSGPAETVVKHYVRRNYVERLGRPLTIAPDQGRGARVEASLRMHPLYDRLFPVVDGAGVDGAGIGVTVKQIGRELVLDCYTPRTYPRLLSEASGVVIEWSYSAGFPTATRVVVGGPGEAQLRVWRSVVRAELESEWGEIVERVRDARDVDADSLQLLPVRGNETLDEGAPKSGLSVKLSETKNFRYGAVRVGDVVNLEVGPGVTVGPEVLREATMSWTKEEGLQVQPTIGERSDDPSRVLATLLRKIARTLVRQNVER